VSQSRQSTVRPCSRGNGGKYGRAMNLWRWLRCRLTGHSWQPYGYRPRVHYRPHVVRCDRCLKFQFENGDPIDEDLARGLRPYPPPPEPGEPFGWTSYRPR
jgi:hypothetical protein